MFIGREEEMALLEKLYASNEFEFLVLYGRRRTGKTELLNQFYSRHREQSVFFTCIEQNMPLNLEEFSKDMQKHFSKNYIAPFPNWKNAFEYVANSCGDDRTVIIIDEFPYIAKEDASIKSILQHTIDKIFKNKNVFLIVCGSSVSFIEDEILGEKSPLYGRCTSRYELKPFDYYTSAKFFPNWTSEEKLIAYGILDGIPLYLNRFKDNKSITENIAENILEQGAMLREEPQYLLRTELRAPARYNSILEAVAGGATQMNQISGKIHEDTPTTSKYINTLKTMRLISKDKPCLESETSRNTIYTVQDNFFTFWYKYIFGKDTYLNIMGSEKYAQQIMEAQNINSHMGHIFEKVTRQYMVRQAQNGNLPFIPAYIDRWWGNNSQRKAQDDVDLLLVDITKKKYILCECKFKNEQFSKDDYETMLSRKAIFSQGEEFYFYAFSKSGFTDYVQKQASKDGVVLVDADGLFYNS